MSKWRLLCPETGLLEGTEAGGRSAEVRDVSLFWLLSSGLGWELLCAGSRGGDWREREINTPKEEFPHSSYCSGTCCVFIYVTDAFTLSPCPPTRKAALFTVGPRQCLAHNGLPVGTFCVKLNSQGSWRGVGPRKRRVHVDPKEGLWGQESGHTRVFSVCVCGGQDGEQGSTEIEDGE